MKRKQTKYCVLKEKGGKSIVYKMVNKSFTASTQNTFEKDLAMMQYFQEEFMYRQTHYWNILIKSFLLVISVSILPVASQVFGIEIKTIPIKTIRFFPLMGIGFALLGLFALLKEAEKIQSANVAKYRINRQYMRKRYHYEYYNDNVGQSENETKKRKWMSYIVPFVVLAVELMIIACVFIIISHGEVPTESTNLVS